MQILALIYLYACIATFRIFFNELSKTRRIFLLLLKVILLYLRQITSKCVYI